MNPLPISPKQQQTKGNKMRVAPPLVFLLVVLAFMGGYLFNQTVEPEASVNRVTFNVNNKDAPQNVVNLDMSKFWKVLGIVEDRYLYADDLVPQELVDGATKGLVDALGDPYTSYYSPEENDGFYDGLEGVYEGIGAQLGFKDEKLAIIAPLEDSPAEKAGIHTGDFILAVDGESTVNWSIPKAVDKIRGKAGTSVALTLMRSGELIDVDIQRQKITIPAVRLTWLDGGIAHIRVLRFGSDTNSEWDKIVNELLMNDVQGVILDVRNNPGGLLNSAVYLASEFFTDGVVVKRQYNTEVTTLEVDHRCRLCDIPVVGLINEGSASASEILLGAIQARDRGELVGEVSFGKGTVQEVYDLSGGSSVHVTTSRWLLPNDQSIHEEGLTPEYIVDTEVVAGPFEEIDGDDQLNAAYKLLTTGTLVIQSQEQSTSGSE